MKEQIHVDYDDLQWSASQLTRVANQLEGEIHTLRQASYILQDQDGQVIRQQIQKLQSRIRQTQRYAEWLRRLASAVRSVSSRMESADRSMIKGQRTMLHWNAPVWTTSGGNSFPNLFTQTRTGWSVKWRRMNRTTDYYRLGTYRLRLRNGTVAVMKASITPSYRRQSWVGLPAISLSDFFLPGYSSLEITIRNRKTIGFSVTKVPDWLINVYSRKLGW